MFPVANQRVVTRNAPKLSDRKQVKDILPDMTTPHAPETDFLTMQEVTDRHGISARTVQRHVAAGLITRYRAARDRRVALFDAEEVAALYAGRPTPA